MGPKLFSAIRLYVDGVRDGHLDVALDKYVADEPVRAGLTRQFAPLIEAHERRSVIPLRGFEDGHRVFVHSFQTFGMRAVEQIGIDIFDTDDDDHIVGHRNITVPLASGSRSGASQIDGPTHVEDIGATADNKALIRAYADDVLVGGRFDRAPDYVSEDAYAQHDPDIAAGLDGYLRYLGDMAASGTPVRYASIDTVVGSGNFVATSGRCSVGDEPFTVADLFRVERGRIVEHWDARAAA